MPTSCVAAFGLRFFASGKCVHACRGAEAADYLAAHLEAHLAARWHNARSAGELLAGALAGADAAFRAEQDDAWAAR